MTQRCRRHVRYRINIQIYTGKESLTEADASRTKAKGVTTLAEDAVKSVRSACKAATGKVDQACLRTAVKAQVAVLDGATVTDYKASQLLYEVEKDNARSFFSRCKVEGRSANVCYAEAAKAAERDLGARYFCGKGAPVPNPCLLHAWTQR